ncbi:MAG: DUF2779 domain-containing protein [Verrucomicrobiales bacterium]|nr:DUF2779 domain-containing protein [Verrucomicrobiales bacterium]
MARSVYLTKSDFKKARECPTKLYYKKNKYPSRLDDDPYLAFLADGGFMVETMSRALFPEGDTIGDWSNPAKAHKASEKAIRSGDGTWFEPTILNDPYLIRIDILRREGNVLHLIEVKSSSIEPIEDVESPFRGKRGQITSKWKPYLEDVTFQALVLESAFPEFEVKPYLCVVDKTKDAGKSSTYDRFRMIPPAKGEPVWRAEFEYLGDEKDLKDEHLLAFVDVSKEVAEIRDEVDLARQDFAKSLSGGKVKKIEMPPRYKCRNCEYRIKDKKVRKHGFEECWGPLAEQEPHILDLFRVDLLGGKARDIPQEMAERGDVRFSAIPADAFGEGVTAERQHIQIAGREWSAPVLKQSLLAHPYPLHFIDFEGSRIALPYHEKMRPYEQVGFQWSCHTIREPGGPIEHAEWLDDTEAFPNFQFAQSLKDLLGTEGTVYIWSPYELTMLRDVREQMVKYGYNDPDLAVWLEDFDAGRDDWVIDLCAMARKYYFHPEMKGSVSIKAVFPAVWRHNRDVRKLSCFKGVSRGSEDPYKSLPALPVGDDEEVVREGTGAIRVYQDMMFGLAGQNPEKRAAYRKLLLQYCHLDTAAMVAIWWHWTQPKRKETPLRKLFRFPWS